MILISSNPAKLSILKSTLVACTLFLGLATFPQSAVSNELVSNISSKDMVDKPKEKADFLNKLKGIEAQEDKTEKDNSKPKKPITVYEDEEPEEVESENKKGIAKVYLTIAVPHSKGPVISVKAYPYPPKPEKPSFHMELPETDKKIKKSLLDSGYMNRTSDDNPFPSGGWRMQYALAKAKKKSKISSPHSILEHYRWANRMVKYIKPELLKINEFEKGRTKRYYDYQNFWTDNHKVLRNKAIRQSLEPLRMRPLPRDPNKFGRNFGGVFPSGQWWIKIKYKVKGLSYHWIFALDLKDKDQIVLLANEANAIQISGGW